METRRVDRIITLGASNLTRGLGALLAAAGAQWGPQLEVFAAPGHGRSYGSRSRFLARELPGIIECGIWRALDAEPQARTRALVMDIGNDILYGFPPQQILTWVDTVVRRLQRHTGDIIVTDLPMEGIRSLSQARFLIFRLILVPSCRLSLSQVQGRAEHLSEGLARMAGDLRIAFLRPDASWYGIDPVHIRRPLYPQAWRKLLGIGSGGEAPRTSSFTALKLALLPPERRWLFGMEQTCPQHGIEIPGGTRLRLY